MRAHLFMPNPGAFWLWSEFTLLFIGMPSILTFFPPVRWVMLACLWGAALYALAHIAHAPGFCWKTEWRGMPWSVQGRRIAWLRAILVCALIVLSAWALIPEAFLGFPRRNLPMWLTVMVLYPILSVLPQEILFRSFFFTRYKTLFPHPWFMILASSLAYGFLHIMYHNWVAPLLSFFGGILFCLNYQRHRSLLWVCAEHALYGCMIFTVGWGMYFYFNAALKL